MKAIAVIPARLASTRLPHKMLREVAGIPLIGHVYKAVRLSPLLEDVIVATDSDEILQICRKNGWNARMTSPAHRSGTERVHEISNSMHADVYVNVQGDEPMTRSEHIASLLGVMENPAVQVGTLATPASPEVLPTIAATSHRRRDSHQPRDWYFRPRQSSSSNDHSGRSRRVQHRCCTLFLFSLLAAARNLEEMKMVDCLPTAAGAA